MPQVKYRVAGVSRGTVERQATVGGIVVPAMVPSLIVELVSDDGGMGHTFSFVGDVTEAEALFTADAEVFANFEAA